VGCELVGGDGALHEPTDALAGVFIDDLADLDRPAAFVAIELETDRPHHVRRDLRGRLHDRGFNMFEVSALRDTQPFLTPQPLDLFVVHRPALTAGVIICTPASLPRVFLRISTQPVPQPTVRVRDRVSLEWPTVCRSAQPGHTKRHPLAHHLHSHQMNHGGMAPALGLEVSLRQLLQRSFLQLCLSQQPLQCHVMLLEHFEAFRVLGLHPALLVSPPIVRLLADAELAADRRDVAACTEHPVGLTKLAHDLLRRMPLPCVRHDLTNLFVDECGRQDDSHNYWT
jgi:hypothetical protein